MYMDAAIVCLWTRTDKISLLAFFIKKRIFLTTVLYHCY